MMDLRIRARADGVVVRFVSVKDERFIKRYAVPITRIAIPHSGHIPIGGIPNFHVFGMSTCSRAGVCVKFANGEVD